MEIISTESITDYVNFCELALHAKTYTVEMYLIILYFRKFYKYFQIWSLLVLYSETLILIKTDRNS